MVDNIRISGYIFVQLQICTPCINHNIIEHNVLKMSRKLFIIIVPIFLKDCVAS